ncbi:interleukin-12 subunit beta [Plectropomus leopardus]|uniref:interleukin-12 subunit beta n=1 Tax=Plectropomus leopardus TaxID=160734 RepID=UPI001C4C13BB|nr:interleukin-12 subunit beta [Plectropomus leopardus]
MSLQCNLIQMMTLSLWICGLLCISLTGAHELKHFPKHFVVAKHNVANPVTLTCHTETNGPVTWMFDEDFLDFNGNIKQNGQNLSVSMVDKPMLGEYSCWRGGEMLSSTYLLLEADAKDVPDSFSIKHWAKSYDCNLSCEWIHEKQTAVRLGLGPDCKKGMKSCHWVSSDQPVHGRFHFELSHSLSPYTEESTMLQLTAEAIVDDYFIRKTFEFYLRDIIKPDSPQIGKCEKEGENLNVTVNAPSSWSTPQSFFSLEHQIEYVLQDNGKPGLSSSALIPKGTSKLRARSRDPLVLSNWSEWTPWKNVITGKKNQCKCKNTVKSCCPELPPEFLDNCKKKRKKNRNKAAQRSQTSFKENVQ